MGSSGGSSTTVERADPWEGVQPFLRQGYSDANQLYGGTAPQYYPGETVAPFNEIQEAGNLSAINFATQGAPNLYNTALGSVQRLLDPNAPGHAAALGGGSFRIGGGGGGGYAPQQVDPLARQTAATLMGAVDPARNAGFVPAQQLAGMSDPTQFLGYQQMQGLQAASDPSQNVAAGAQAGLMGMADPAQLGGYGAIERLMQAGDVQNNPYFQGAVEASLRPVAETFREQILPGIRSNAGAMGQVGSSRQGIAEGLAAARANQQMTDIAAQMGNQAYGQGLQAMAAAGGLGADYGRLGQSALAQAGQLGTAITGQQLQGLGQAGQLGNVLQGQALGNLQSGSGLLSQQYQQGLQAGQAGAGLEFASTQAENQNRAEMARARAQVQAAQAGATAQARQAQLNSQMQALGMLPMISGLGLQQSQILGGVGGQYQTQGQNFIDADQARWNYEQQQPYAMLNDYMAMLAGAPGGARSIEQPTTSNPLMNAIGMGATGYAAGSALAGTAMTGTMLGMGPAGWGALVLGAMGLLS